MATPLELREEEIFAEYARAVRDDPKTALTVALQALTALNEQDGLSFVIAQDLARTSLDEEVRSRGGPPIKFPGERIVDGESTFPFGSPDIVTSTARGAENIPRAPILPPGHPFDTGPSPFSRALATGDFADPPEPVSSLPTKEDLAGRALTTPRAGANLPADPVFGVDLPFSQEQRDAQFSADQGFAFNTALGQAGLGQQATDVLRGRASNFISDFQGKLGNQLDVLGKNNLNPLEFFQGLDFQNEFDRLSPRQRGENSLGLNRAARSIF